MLDEPGEDLILVRLTACDVRGTRRPVAERGADARGAFHRIRKRP